MSCLQAITPSELLLRVLGLRDALAWQLEPLH